MKVFLIMKAWQLFALLFGAVLLVVATGITGGDPGPTFTIAMVVSCGVFLAWIWALGTNINRWVPEDIRPSSRYFKLGLLYASVYGLLFLAFVTTTPTGPPGTWFVAVILPLHLLGMVCMFYALYFIAQNFVMAERRQKVGFYECAGPFFLVWMYPLGVWFIQPRVNRMFEEHENTQRSS